MVGKWSVRNPLTLAERRKLAKALKMNMTYAQISVYVGRCKSVVLRESKRLGGVENYHPEEAQTDFEKKQIERRIRKKKVEVQ